MPICILSSLWLSLVVNFVDVDGTLRSELLTISYFKGRHTAERIAEFVIRTAKQWKIEDKFIHIGSDNAANMKKAFDTVLEIEPEPVIDRTDDDGEQEEIDDEFLETASISIFEYLSDGKRTFRRTDISSRTFRRRHFVARTFRRTDISSHGHFVARLLEIDTFL